jgi:D-alanine-D-alanine ligase
MTMKPIVDENWWMSIFDGVYLQTDARSVDDDRLTCEETDFLENGLNLRRNWQILDLCGGQGRHALELSRRGFLNLTVFDYSEYLLLAGKNRAAREKLPVLFARGDARRMGLQDGIYDFVMLMGSSFGYFIHEEENLKILAESFRLLGSPGTILLDLPDRNHVMRHFNKHSHHRANDQMAVIRDRILEDDIIYCREQVLDADGHAIRDKVYCSRLYSRKRIQELLGMVGFQDVHFQSDFMCREKLGDYGCMTNRMLVLANKQ